jgi:hypothetical protein
MAKGARSAKEKGGRATPKGTRASGRYTPPIPREQKVSPPWVPIVMFGCLGLGVLMIVLNYLNLLPGDASNGYLLGGLALITVGFIAATQYH